MYFYKIKGGSGSLSEDEKRLQMPSYENGDPVSEMPGPPEFKQ